MSQYQPHKPGEAPPVPDRKDGVQSFAVTAEPDPCPDGMIYDPVTGECVPEEGNEQ